MNSDAMQNAISVLQSRVTYLETFLGATAALCDQAVSNSRNLDSMLCTVGGLVMKADGLYNICARVRDAIVYDE